ncbi:MAG: SulP family inorganic anion transporter [Gemmataceae bacterium]
MANTPGVEDELQRNEATRQPSDRKSLVQFVFRYVPAIGALRNYSPKSLGADTLAGLTVATVTIPQGLAYAQLAGVPPQYGLYTAIVMTLVGALFDSSRQLINGPTSAISIAVLGAIGMMDNRAHAAMLLALMIGVIQIVITALRLGDLTRYVSHGVIVGFTVGAGVLLGLGQLPSLLGIPPPEHHHEYFLTHFAVTMSKAAEGNVTTALVGLGTILLVVGLRAGKKKLPRKHRLYLPELLLSLLIVSILVWVFRLDQRGVATIGQQVTIPRMLPSFSLDFLDWRDGPGDSYLGALFAEGRYLAGSALAIAILGLLESVAMAKSIAAQTKQKLDINQQCLSEGLANFAGSLFQCIPGSGSLTRSTINVQAGAVSQWSGVIAAVAVGGAVLLLGNLIGYIPYAALAGILIVSAYRLVDRKQLLYHLRATRFDAGIVLVTAFSAIFISIEFCILIGVILSFVLYIPRAARLEMQELIVTPERVIRERGDEIETCNKILIFSIEGEMFFGSAPELEKHLEAVRERASRGAQVVVLRLRQARNPDGVCLEVLSDFILEMHEREVVVLLSGLRQESLDVFRSTGLDKVAGEDRLFEEVGSDSSTRIAVQTAYDYLKGDYCLSCPRRHLPEAGQENWYYMI